GHPHPILIRSDGTQRNLGSGGLPVGLIPGADYETFTIDMAVGDRLVILSDGFIEAELPDGSLLGEDGLAHLLGETRALPLPRILDTLVWRLSQICGDTGFADDLSGVVISYDPD
ncbi:MAG: PP2C family protein-serine/threonine phosphatase, partial [Pseudomonadota bacterium]